MFSRRTYRRGKEGHAIALWLIGAVFCFIVNPEGELLGLFIPGWACFASIAVYGMIAGYWVCEHPKLGAISGGLLTIGVLTVLSYLGPGVVALPRDRFFWGRTLFVLVGIAPAYCCYHVGREIIECTAGTDKQVASETVDWMGTQHTRRRPLKFLIATVVAITAVAAVVIVLGR